MPVRAIITDPPEPGWWDRNKTTVCVVVALGAGLWLGGGCAGHPSPASTPSGTPAASATASTASTARP